MKLARRENAARNILFGTIQKVSAILFPFAVRTVMLHHMGTEYVGLDSLFTSILSFLSIAELGVGSALVYSMYKPIANDDDNEICALLGLYKKLYTIIGIVIATIGLSLIPILKYLIHADCPDDVNFYVLYLIYLLNSVLSYLFLAYKQALLMAYQRNDISSRLLFFTQAGMYVFQIGLLLFTHNYYFYIIMLPLSTFLYNLLVSYSVDKLYPHIKCRGKVSKSAENSIKKKIYALFGSKISSIVLHASDNIIISIFIGLAMVAQYGNYYYVMNAVVGLTTVIYSSFLAGIGNSLETENKEKNRKDFNILSFGNYWITMFCSCCLLCLYQPFIKIWAGEDLLFDFKMVLLFVVYFYVYQSYRIVLTYKDAAGIWWEDRFRPYVIMIVNVVGNIVLINIIGIYGVIISTIISLIISVPWATYTVFKYIFYSSMKVYIRELVIQLLATIICCSITYIICSTLNFDGFTALLLRFPICVVIPNTVYALLFRQSVIFKQFLSMIIHKPNKLK